MWEYQNLLTIQKTNGIFLKITQDCNELVKHVINIYNIEPTDCKFFPGPQPKSIERSDFEKLFNNSYYVCEKSDGVRYLFVCTVWKGKQICFLMNRKNEIFLIKLTLDKNNYNNTIFDCELVESNRNNELLIFDAILYNNIKLQHLKFSERMKYAQKFMNNYKNKNDEVFQIKKKNMIRYDKDTFKTFVESFKDNDKIDGYIFTPEMDGIKSNTHDNMYKFKNRLDNSVDFKIIYTDKKGFVLLIKDRPVKNNYLSVDKYMEIYDNIKRECIEKNECIVECRYDENNTKNGNIYWIPTLIRKDKSHSNSFFCYKKTLLNIQENITINEFY